MVSIIRTLRRGKMKEQQGTLLRPCRAWLSLVGGQPIGMACLMSLGSGHVDPSPLEVAEMVAWDMGRGGLGVMFPAGSLSS